MDGWVGACVRVMVIAVLGSWQTADDIPSMAPAL